MSVLVQNPQAIGVLRQVQRLEERPGFDLCTLQIRRDVRNPIERGVRVVLFSNAEELNGEHHLVISLRATKFKEQLFGATRGAPLGRLGRRRRGLRLGFLS